MKNVQALEHSNILLKGVTKTSKNKPKEKKGEFLIRNLVNLFFFSFFLLGNLSSGRGSVRAGSGNKQGKGIAGAGYGKEWNF